MIDIQVKGGAALSRKLAKLGSSAIDVFGVALYQEAEIEMTEAKRRTPVKTGALRASGAVRRLSRVSRDLAVVLGFGGPAVQYALRVHEDVEMFHRVGQAKYLESVLLESAPYIAARVAKRAQSLGVWGI
jgi:hypothetical protein